MENKSGRHGRIVTRAQARHVRQPNQDNQQRQGRSARSYEILLKGNEQGCLIELSDRGGNLALSVEKKLQFMEGPDDNFYHEKLYTVPAKILNPKKVLIIGGANGLGARNLQNLGIQDITIVDSSAFIFEAAMSHPRLLRLNRNSLRHPSVKILVQDAFNYIIKCAMFKKKKGFDMVFVEYPVMFDYKKNSIPRGVRATGRGKVMTPSHYRMLSEFCDSMAARDDGKTLHDDRKLKYLLMQLYPYIKSMTFRRDEPFIRPPEREEFECSSRYWKKPENEPIENMDILIGSNKYIMLGRAKSIPRESQRKTTGRITKQTRRFRN